MPGVHLTGKGFIAAAVRGSRLAAPASSSARSRFRSSAVSTSYHGRVHATRSPAADRASRVSSSVCGTLQRTPSKHAGGRGRAAAIITQPPSSAGPSATSQWPPSTKAQPSSSMSGGKVGLSLAIMATGAAPAAKPAFTAPCMRSPKSAPSWGATSHPSA